MGEFLGVVIGVLLLGMTGFGIRYCALEQNKYFAPKERALSNQVFKQSEQYNDSMTRDLENFRLDYIKADVETKEVIKATVLHRYAVYNSDGLSSDLRLFLRQLKGE